MAASAQALCSGTVSEPTYTTYLPLPPIFSANSLAWASPKPCDRDHLKVPVRILLVGRFMGDDLDPGIAGLLQHRLEHVGVVGDHADHIDALGDEILDGAHLQGRIGAGRPDHEAVIAKFLATSP